MADLRISSLPQVAPQRAPVLDRSAAQRQDYGFQPASTGNELAGLVNGLATLNPALQRYGEQESQEAQKQARLAGIAEAQRRALSSSKEAQGLIGNPLPSSVSPAFGKYYDEGFAQVMGDRASSLVKADYARAYHEAKDTEGFNPAAFVQDFRAKHMAGFTDPILAAKVGDSINGMEVDIRNDVEKQQMQKQAEVVNSALAMTVRERLAPTASIEALTMAYHNEILPAFRAVNKSPKEAQDYLLSHLTDMSARLGGAPQLFDIFDMPGPDGRKLSDFNTPAVAAAIRSAQEHATSMLTRNMHQAGQKNLFRDSLAMDKMRDANPASITPELMSSNIGEFGRFPGFKEALSYLEGAQRQLQQQLGLEQMQAHYHDGSLWRLPEKEQKALIEHFLGPQINELAAAFSSGKPQEVGQKAAVLVQEVARRVSSVAIPALTQMIETVITAGVQKDGPSPGFQSLVELYKAFSAVPNQRALYFKGDVADIMETYSKLAANNSDTKAAYFAAHESVSPASKKSAEAQAATPEFKAIASGQITNVVGSTNWLPHWTRHLGSNGKPQNIDFITADTSAAMMDYKKRHPNSTTDDLKAFAESHTKTNYVLDTTTHTAIKVPPKFANERTQEAISDYTKRIMSSKRFSEMTGDWRVEIRPKGTEGLVDVVMVSSAGAMDTIAQKNLEEINQAFYNEKHIDHTPRTDGSMNEGQKLISLQQQITSGKVDAAFVGANQALIAKARMTGALPSESIAKLDKLYSDQMMARLTSVPKMSFGAPDASAISTIKQRGAAMVDTKATALMARQFAKPAAPYGAVADSRSLALSLMVMSEGVVKQAYDDPAHGAGKNIGTGYNLKANAATAHEELKRAGVPDESIQGVIDGKLQMTTEQVQKLAQVAIVRYEKIARKAAPPGIWDRMTPQQQAVMIDVAYQVGDAAQFRQAWKALEEGDEKGFAEHAKTTYEKSPGVRVTDKRRNGLRAYMLAGPASWDAAVTKYGSLPSNSLETAALYSK